MQDTTLSGQPLICQLLSFIPREIIDQKVLEFGSDKYYKKMFTFHQLVFLAYGIVSKTKSLNCLCKSLIFLDGKLSYLGIKELPATSTLSDANINRESNVFEAIYNALYEYYTPELAGGNFTLPINGEVNSSHVKRFDATTFSLFSAIFKAADRKPLDGSKPVRGVKMQTLLGFDSLVPEYLQFGAAAKNDKNFLGQLEVKKWYTYIFDKGYINYTVYQQWTEKEVYFVTRMQEGGKFNVIKEYPVDNYDISCGVGIVSDQLIGVYVSGSKSSLILRLVTYKDPNSGKTLEFLTNNLEWKADTICLLYRYRWAIEPFFKQIKQNFQLSHFYSDSQEGILTQIWVAMILNLIFTVIFQRIKQAVAFIEMVSMAKNNLGTYKSFIKVLKTKKLSPQERNAGIVQLNLFEKSIGGTFENQKN